MSGGTHRLQEMRRIIDKTPSNPSSNPFDVFGDKTDLYSHVFALTGKRHVALRRTSKAMHAASDGAGKKTAVEYIVDTLKFNKAEDWKKVEQLMDDLGRTCAKFDVQRIKMCGLRQHGTHMVKYQNFEPVLRACPGLTSLDLSHNGMKEIEPIATALAGCTGLTRLDLSGNHLHFGEDTLRGLEQCKALRELNLYGNYLNDNDMRILTNEVDHFPALEDLDLGRNSLKDPDQAESLIAVLAERCTGLTRLSLRENGMTPETVEGLCNALPKLAALAHLDLARNNMGGRGLNFLGRVLAACTSLESLDVGHNMIASPWEKLTSPFTDALPGCLRLRRLDISVNDLGIHLWTELLKVLSRCSALEHLSLFDCGVENTWVDTLLPLLPMCYALRELDLRMNSLQPTVHAALRTAWAEVKERDPQRLLLLPARVL